MAEGPITLTLKGGTGYDAPWLVVSAESFNALEYLFEGSYFEGAYKSAVHAIREGNVLADVKATLGATEDGPPTPPVAPVQPAAPVFEKPSRGLIAVAAKKSGKTAQELEGLSVADVQAIIKEASK